MSLTPSPCNVWWAPITVRRREGEKEGEKEGKKEADGRKKGEGGWSEKNRRKRREWGMREGRGCYENLCNGIPSFPGFRGDLNTKMI